MGHVGTDKVADSERKYEERQNKIGNSESVWNVLVIVGFIEYEKFEHVE